MHSHLHTGYNEKIFVGDAKFHERKKNVCRPLRLFKVVATKAKLLHEKLFCTFPVSHQLQNIYKQFQQRWALRAVAKLRYIIRPRSGGKVRLHDQNLAQCNDLTK
jgi:hypothetical protein